MSKKSTIADWDHHAVLYAVRRTGTTLSQLSITHGLTYGVLRSPLYKPVPRYERIIAAHLGVLPQTIWPSRYHLDGTPKSGRGERGLGRFKAKYKFNGSISDGNVKLTGEQST